jgi:hypothetical protein
MRRALSLTVALLLAGGLCPPAFAQEPQVTIGHEITPQGLNTEELAAFDQVANSNLKMRRRLAANPHLANSESFLRRWPDLNNFFAKYPGSKDRFLDDPGNYLSDVHMHNGHLVTAVHRKKSAAAPPATPAEAAPPAPEGPTVPGAAPAAPEPAAPPAAPPSSP